MSLPQAPTFNLLSLLSGYTLGGGGKSNVDLSVARTQNLQKQLVHDQARHSRMHRPDSVRVRVRVCARV